MPGYARLNDVRSMRPANDPRVPPSAGKMPACRNPRDMPHICYNGIGGGMMDIFEAETTEDGLELYRLGAWQRKFPGLSAGITSRIGGEGEAPYDTLNCALHVGDDPRIVIENRKKVSRAAGFAPEAWTCAEQVHGCRVHIVGESERGAGLTSRESAIPDADALATDRRGLMLTAFYADCVPIFLLDPDRRAVALAHAGWKGTALNIAGETVAAMRRAFGSRPERLLAAIGPAIGGCCYEVDSRVVEQIGAPPPPRKENGRFMLDLKEINRQFMIRAGLLPIHIEVSGYCTRCSADRFFSHRAGGGRTGRMAAWIGWRNEVNT